MRIICKFLIVFLILTSTLNAQKSHIDTLVLKDGRVLIGKVKFAAGKKISITSDGKRKIKYESIRSVTSVNSKGKVKWKYYFKKIKKTGKIVSLKKTISGNLEYFFMEVDDGSGVVRIKHYIGRNEEDFVTQIKYGPRFRKFQITLNEFFIDCDDLVIKIKDDFFGQNIKAIPKIIEYHNNNCN